jgi:hypothetical protein
MRIMFIILVVSLIISCVSETSWVKNCDVKVYYKNDLVMGLYRCSVSFRTVRYVKDTLNYVEYRIIDADNNRYDIRGDSIDRIEIKHNKE